MCTAKDTPQGTQLMEELRAQEQGEPEVGRASPSGCLRLRRGLGEAE